MSCATPMEHTCAGTVQTIYSISKILGHKDISVTARIYVHNEIAELRKAVRWCNRREPIQEEYIP